MIIDVARLLLTKGIKTAECAYCGNLLGFKDADIHEFTSKTHDKILKAIECPQCDGFLLLNLEEDQDEDSFGQIEEIDFE